MSSETHEIRLIAKDGASNVFRMAGTNAERMNQQIERSNQRTKRSWDEIGRTAQKAAAAIGAGSIIAINAANKSEVSQTRLKQSIENTGHAYEEYADAVNKASKASIKKAFDDEDAADAISKLTQATNDASKAIADLSIAEDVARGRGISLEAATNIVVAAEQGRIGALKRMGIQIDDNATKEQALAALQTKYAGQAQAYANTNAATWDRARIQAENALESIGAKLAKHQTEILAASAAWTAFGGSLANVVKILGVGGTAGLGGALAILGGVGYLGYDYTQTRGKAGSNATDSFFGGYFGGAASLLGLGGIASQFRGITSSNKVEDQLISAFYGYGGADEKQLVQLIRSLGLTYSGNSGAQLNALKADAARYGLSAGQYAINRASSQGYVLDPISGQYMSQPESARLGAMRGSLGGGTTSLAAAQARGNIGSGLNAGAARPSASAAAAGNYPSASSMGSGLAQQTQALKAQYGEWYHLADGEVTAKDALEAFGLAQQNVLKVESKYSGQLSEYSGQLNALQAAYDEVNAKKESGAQLTKQETQFLDGYTDANARLTGGVYDSTLALGLQAEKYADNMTAADEFKAAGDGVTDSIYALIAALAGIPGYVKTTVEADTSQFWAAITPLLGQQIGSAYINVYANRIGFGATPEQHGGLTMAQHGYAGTSRSIMVGEAGPEILDIGGGSTFVTPAAASKFSNKKRKMDGDGMTVSIANLTVVANSPKQFGDALRSYALAGSRN